MKRLYGLDSVSAASPTESTSAATGTSLQGHPEWTGASPLRPVAHWVKLPDGKGGRKLSMVWEVPNPLPSSAH
ncbi:hypothetical protein Kisp01_13090 [Kineosporia sp. NBRC 101677]|uniref:hypothetical protein n=1 Tax=Kineosporia sp. NBRC 101677 TaxID=3032197 RepID=UPI0024A37FE8|nr:hypothetical protein [Kineosporia sp. NBRC 101677]GLY14293.1 hypothetical protein Kisp01_13090 [Kineosporia sp. NBRC 101677]